MFDGLDNDAMLWVIGVTSVLMLVLSAVAVPLVVARLPADYLVTDDADAAKSTAGHPLLRVLLLVVRNLFGWLLIIAGIAMLIAPGQGLLAIVVGLTLVSFPGKQRLLRKLLGRDSILRAANWIRDKCGVEPLQAPGDR